VEYMITLFIANGAGSFTSSQEWIRRVTGTLFCTHCHNVLESVKQIDAVVANKSRRSDIDLIAVNCGHVRLVSTHFIEVVGQSLIEKTAGLGKLLDEGGFEHKRYRTAISQKNPVVVRGPKKSNVGLCRECGRLLYWPIEGEYVLRHDLPKEPLFLSDSRIYCTPEYYENRLSTAMLRQVDTRQIPIIDEPLDGLPLATEDLKSYLRDIRKFK